MLFIQQTVTLIPIFYLQIIPPSLIVIIYFVSLLFKRKNRFVWLLALIQTLSCALLAFHAEGGATVAFAFGALMLFLNVLFAPLLFFKDARIEPENFKMHSSESFDAVQEGEMQSAAPVPTAVVAQNNTPMPATDSVNGDVHLAHVLQVLKKLQTAKLSASDRLEVDVIQNMLTVYQAKVTLSSEETRTLNNYLGTLLKLMSKYSV